MNPNTSERSDAGISIEQEVFGFVKRNLSGAQRRKDAASGERSAGKGAAALVPAQRWRDPECDQCSDSQLTGFNQHCGVQGGYHFDSPGCIIA